MAELGGELGLSAGDEVVIKLFLYEVDGAAAEAATHHAGTSDIHLPCEFVEEVELLAADLVEAAQAEVSLIHKLTHSLVVSPFESIADVKHALHFANHVLGTQEVLLRNLSAHLVEPEPVAVAETFYLRMILFDSGSGILAGLAALVVC